MLRKMAEMNSVDFMKHLKKTKSIILPSGAYELWGPHLPLGADTVMAEEVAWRVAEKMDWIVGPTVPVGYSDAVWGDGTLTMRPEIFKEYMRGICVSLIKHGVEKICFINPHLGNVPALAQLSTDIQKKYFDVKCCIVDWWRFIQPLARNEKITQFDGPMAHGHASEAGTSCFMYVRPDLVKTNRLERVEPLEDEYPDIQRFMTITQRSKSGVVGDATVASRAKGEQLVEKSVNRIVSFLKQWQ